MADDRAHNAILEAHRHDWDWLEGRWNVRHRRLKSRLTGSNEWDEFDGACTMTRMMDGLGNVDDNWLDIPSGAYRAIGVRAFDPATQTWAIWWLDGRSPDTIGPPVRGGFRNGVGEFQGADTHNNIPIIARFRWTDIAPRSARWEQAFSTDNGATWEVNWSMRFTRV